MIHAKILVQLHHQHEEIFDRLKNMREILTLGQLLEHLKLAMEAFNVQYPILSI